MPIYIDHNLTLIRVIVGCVAVGASFVAMFYYINDYRWARKATNGESYLRGVALAMVIRETFRMVKQIILAATAILTWRLTNLDFYSANPMFWSDVGTWLQIIVLLLFFLTTFVDLYTRWRIRRGGLPHG